MIDLHCHLLPGIDDGAPDLATALEMARLAVEDGIVCTACTPHIYPGVYENTGPGIRKAVARLRNALEEAQIPLKLSHGADVQLAPDLVGGLRCGRIPTLHDSRYFLFEPPHHVAPPRFLEVVYELVTAGYVPVITHPERLRWIEDHYDWFAAAAGQGAWMQLTAGAVVGRFGRGPRYWAERMLDEGIVHLLATDAHDPVRRGPWLAEGAEAAAKRVGGDEAQRLVLQRPQAILDDCDPKAVPRPPGLQPGGLPARRPRWWRRWFRGAA